MKVFLILGSTLCVLAAPRPGDIPDTAASRDLLTLKPGFLRDDFVLCLTRKECLIGLTDIRRSITSYKYDVSENDGQYILTLIVYTEEGPRIVPVEDVRLYYNDYYATGLRAAGIFVDFVFTPQDEDWLKGALGVPNEQMLNETRRQKRQVEDGGNESEKSLKSLIEMEKSGKGKKLIPMAFKFEGIVKLSLA